MMHGSSKEILDYFLRLNRSLEALARRLRPPLTNVETHVLSEVLQTTKATAHDLVTQLNLDKSTVSRLVADLKTRKLVKVTRVRGDKRFKGLGLTERGTETLEADLGLRNIQVTSCISPLSREEQYEFCRLLSEIADGFGTSIIKPVLADEHPAVAQIRRITRAMGILRGNFLGTGLPKEWCQIMNILAAQPQEIAMMALRDMLPYESSFLSRLVSALEHRGYVRRTISKHDKRQFMLELTSAGKKSSEKTEQVACAALGQVLGKWPNSSVKRLLFLFSRFLGGDTHADRVAVHDAMRVERVRTSEERSLARAFLIENLVRTNTHSQAPETLISRHSACYVLIIANLTQGVIEFSRESSTWRIINFSVAPDLSSTTYPLRLLATALDDVLKRKSADSVSSSCDALTPLLKPYGTRELGDGTFEIGPDILPKLFAASEKIIN
jgi:DNA-binding MarR family transcriptional regulator